MSPSTSPAQIADSAAEAIRLLNHATIAPAALSLSDTYDILSSMLDITGRLPQALNQIAAAVAHTQAQPLYADDGADPHDHISTVIDELTLVAGLVNAASSRCCAAHRSLARLGVCCAPE